MRTGLMVRRIAAAWQLLRWSLGLSLLLQAALLARSLVAAGRAGAGADLALTLSSRKLAEFLPEGDSTGASLLFAASDRQEQPGADHVPLLPPPPASPFLSQLHLTLVDTSSPVFAFVLKALQSSLTELGVPTAVLRIPKQELRNASFPDHNTTYLLLAAHHYHIPLPTGPFIAYNFGTSCCRLRRGRPLAPAGGRRCRPPIASRHSMVGQPALPVQAGSGSRAFTAPHHHRHCTPPMCTVAALIGLPAPA